MNEGMFIVFDLLALGALSHLFKPLRRSSLRNQIFKSTQPPLPQQNNAMLSLVFLFITIVIRRRLGCTRRLSASNASPVARNLFVAAADSARCMHSFLSVWIQSRDSH